MIPSPCVEMAETSGQCNCDFTDAYDFLNEIIPRNILLEFYRGSQQATVKVCCDHVYVHICAQSSDCVYDQETKSCMFSGRTNSDCYLDFGLTYEEEMKWKNWEWNRNLKIERELKEEHHSGKRYLSASRKRKKDSCSSPAPDEYDEVENKRLKLKVHREIKACQGFLLNNDQYLCQILKDEKANEENFEIINSGIFQIVPDFPLLTRKFRLAYYKTLDRLMKKHLIVATNDYDVLRSMCEAVKAITRTDSYNSKHEQLEGISESVLETYGKDRTKGFKNRDILIKNFEGQLVLLIAKERSQLKAIPNGNQTENL